MFFRSHLFTILWLIVFGLILGLAQPFVIASISDTPILSWMGYYVFAGLIPIFAGINQAQTLKKGFLFGFLAGLAYFSLCHRWIIIALTDFGYLHPLLSFIILLIMNSYLAFVWGFFGIIFVFIKKNLRSKAMTAFSIAGAWTMLEFIRNYMVAGLGFPWSNIAIALYKDLPFIQIASITGINGVIFAIVFTNSIIWVYLDELKAMVFSLSQKDVFHAKECISHSHLVWSWMIVLALIHAIGLVSIRNIQQEFDLIPSQTYSILQGNIDQSYKNQSQKYEAEIIHAYTKAAEFAFEADKSIELFIWPESAYPYYVSPKKIQFQRELQPFQKFHIPHLLGIGTMDRIQTEAGEDYQLTNSAIYIDKYFQFQGRYNKHHLVPFGEYVPGESFIKSLGIDKLVPIPGSFSPLREDIIIPHGQTKLGVLICYEGIFPEISRYFTKEGSEILVNITNDAWYGVSAATYQHLAMYVFRAIENRRYVARSANTGVSAIISPWGDIEAQTSIGLMNKRSNTLVPPTFLNGKVKPYSSLTWYTRFGDWFVLLLFVLFSVIVIREKRAKR